MCKFDSTNGKEEADKREVELHEKLRKEEEDRLAMKKRIEEWMLNVTK